MYLNHRQTTQPMSLPGPKGVMRFHGRQYRFWTLYNTYYCFEIFLISSRIKHSGYSQGNLIYTRNAMNGPLMHFLDTAREVNLIQTTTVREIRGTIHTRHEWKNADRDTTKTESKM